MPTIIRDIRSLPFAWQDANLYLRYGWVLEADGLAVYGVLSLFANHETQQAGPGVRRVARLIHRRLETVIAKLQLLEFLHLITIEREAGHTNVYTLLDVSENDPWLLEQVTSGQCVVERGRGSWAFFIAADLADTVSTGGTPCFRRRNTTVSTGGTKPDRITRLIQPVLPGLLKRIPKPKPKPKSRSRGRQGGSEQRGDCRWTEEDRAAKLAERLREPEDWDKGD